MPNSEYLKWDKKRFMKESNGLKGNHCENNFSYNSSTNSHFLSVDELRKLKPEARLVAIEPSPKMAEICRDLDLEVKESMIENLEGHDDQFDFFIAEMIALHWNKFKRKSIS